MRSTRTEAFPTGLLAREHSQYVRTIVAALRNTGYYDIRPFASEEAAERGLAEGEVLFVINVPPNFERSVDRGETLGRAWSAGGEEHSECPIRPIPNTARSPCLLRRKRRETPRLSFFKRPPSRRLFSRSWPRYGEAFVTPTLPGRNARPTLSEEVSAPIRSARSGIERYGYVNRRS